MAATNERFLLATPGVCLALCFSEQLMSGGDVHGLLFGTRSTETRTMVGDMGSKDVTETFINIHLFLKTTFFDKYGNVDSDAVKKAVESQSTKQLLGWYCFRANTPLRPSMREMFVHKQFESLDCLKSEEAKDYPKIFGLLTTSTTTNTSTHSFDYRFVQRVTPQSPVQSLELRISNLKHDSQAEYGAFNAFAGLPNDNNAELAAFSEVPSAVVRSMQAYSNEQQKLLETLISDLLSVQREEASEHEELFRLREEVSKLST